MNIQTKMPSTADEFLRWNEGREGKREFVHGRVVELMINVTKRHAVLAMRLGAILLRSFPYPEFSVGSADVAVETPDGVRYPDIFVDRNTPGGSDLALVASNPVLLVEVLSPSSYGRDFVEKLKDYSAIPSLLHYLIISHEGPRVWLWTCEAGSGWGKTSEIAGRDSEIVLSRLDVTISMSELYAGIEG